MDLLVIVPACLAIGWIMGARWRAGRITPSAAGRVLAARRRAEQGQAKRNTTRQLELYVKRSRR